ncbi:MAG: DsrE family protein [Candidatus Bathyarchaeota archaeon]
MAEKKTLIIIKSRPFTSLNYYEALRTAAGLWNHEVKVLWMGEGVYAALDRADKTLTGKFLADLPDLDIEMYVDEEALKVKGFTEDDLVESAAPANRAKVRELLGWAEASLVF